MDAADPNSKLILQFVNENPDGVTLPQIIAHVNGHDRTIQRLVADLVEARLLKAKGRGRATRYVVPKPRAAGASGAQAADPTSVGSGAADAAAEPPPTSQHSAAAVPVPPLPGSRQPASSASVPSPDTIRPPTDAAPLPSPATVLPRGGTARVGVAAINRQSPARRPAASAVSSGTPKPPAAAPVSRYPDFEELYYHIFPRIVRTCMSRTEAEAVVREQADFDYQTSPRLKQAFIAAAMAKLDGLTVADVHPYGVGPTIYGDWRRAWNAPPGARPW